MKYPSTSGMKQHHWDAIHKYGFAQVGASFTWDEGSYHWRIQDKNRFVYKAKRLVDAVDQMVVSNQQLEEIEKIRRHDK